MAETKLITVKSMVGARTGTGAVCLRLGDEYINLPLASAREIAQQLVECAAAAQQDALLLAAGFAPRDPVATIQDEPEVAALYRALRDERGSALAQEHLRLHLRSLLAVLEAFRRGGSGGAMKKEEADNGKQ